MIKKITLSVLAFFYFGMQVLFAQLPSVCPSSEPPADQCSRACVYCNINGLTSTTVGYTGQQPSGYCGIAENEQWIGFVAGETDVTITAIPSDCILGNGLQIAVYSSCDGSPLACDPGCLGCGSGGRPLSVTGMVPGETYYIVVDGYLGDRCDFTITASPASAVTPPVPQASLRITGLNTVCEGGEFEYCAEPIAGITAYEWTAPSDALINGQPSPAIIVADQPGVGECVTVTFGSQSGAVCVSGVNACFRSPPTCIVTKIDPDIPLVLPDTNICAENVPYSAPWGASVNQTGLYTGNLINPNNCDSTVLQFVNIKLDIPTVLPPSLLCETETMNVCGQTFLADPGTYTTACPRSDGCDSTVLFSIIRRVVPPTIVPPTTLCEDDFLEICGNRFFDPGTFNYTCVGPSGCDSTVVFTIIKQPLDPTISGAEDLSCKNAQTTLSFPNGPGQPTWFADFQVAPVGTGQTLDVFQAGEYVLELTYSVGIGSCSTFDTVNIADDFIRPSADPVNASIGCGVAASIGVNTNAPQAIFNWSGAVSNPTAQFPTVSTAGTYQVTVTNTVNGCTETTDVLATGNIDVPQLSVSSGTIDCGNPTAQLSATSNVPNATFLWSNAQNTADITVNAGGNYTVTVTNPANNCTNEQTVFVNQNTDIPAISASPSGVLTCGNTAVNVSSTSTTSNLSYTWNTNETTPNISVNTAGQYTLTVTATNGCTNAVSVTVNEDLSEPGANVAGGTLTCLQNSLALTANTGASTATFDWGTSNNQTLQVNTSGTYTVTVTGSNGCTSTATATVLSDFDSPNASATGGVLTCTSTTTNLSASSSTSGVSYEWTGPNGAIYTGPNPSVSEAGTYTLTVTSATNGCTATTTAAVTPDLDVPNASATGGTLDCTISSVTLNGASTTPNATLNWSGPNGALTGVAPLVSDPGTYTLTVEDPSNGCTAIANTTVLQDADVPGFSLSGGQITCAQNSLQLQLIPAAGQGTLSFDWSGAGGLSSTDQNPTVGQAGQYTVIVTGANGCTASESVSVIADTEIPQATAQGGTLTCNQNDVQVQLDITTSSMVTSTVWTDDSGAVVSNDEDPIFAVPGTYNVLVTTDNGCSSTASTMIDIDNEVPDIQTDNLSLDCLNPSATLFANSNTGTSFEWSGPNGFTSTDQNPLVNESGTYTIEVTAANGCTASTTASVMTDFTEPDIQVMDGEISCDNPSTSLNATSQLATSYAWTGPNGFTSNDQNPSVGEEGLYTVIVTAPNGCTSSADATISSIIENADITIAAPSTITCFTPVIDLDATIVPPAGSSIASVLWTSSNGFSSTQEDPDDITEAGTYELLVTTQNGCTTSAMVDVLVDNLPPGVASFFGALNCINTEAEISATSPTANTVFEWTGPTGTLVGPTHMVTTAGNYEVVVTNPINGCTSQAEALILQDTIAPDITVTADNIGCEFQSVVLDAQSQTPNLSYSWSGGLANVQDPTAFSGGDYTVTVTNPANGCTNTFDITVLENTTPPDVTVQNVAIPCDMPNVTITAATTAPNVTFEWSLNGVVISTDQSPLVNEAGTYTVIVTDAFGCSTDEQLIVEPNSDAPQITALGGNISCASQNVELTGSSTNTNVSFAWTGPNGFTSQDANPVVDAVGQYTLIVTDLDTDCAASQTVEVEGDLDAPIISIATPDSVGCGMNNTVILDGSAVGIGTLSYAWTTANGTILSGADATNPEVEFGTYTLVVTDDANGCTSEETVEVLASQDVPAGLDVTVNQISCFGEVDGAIQVNAVQGGTAPYVYSFDNEVFGSENSFSALEAGDYSVVVQDSEGCTFETIYSIVEPSELTVDIGSDVSVESGAELDLQSEVVISDPSRVASIIVSPNELYDFLCDTCTGGLYTFLNDVNIELTVIDTNGCEARATRLISVVDSASIYVPNIINPQGAPENARLTVFATTNFVKNIKSFRIYNRLGKLMHTGTNFPPNSFDQSWDGYFDGKLVNSAVYVWMAEIEYTDGTIETHLGDVTVVGQ